MAHELLGADLSVGRGWKTQEESPTIPLNPKAVPKRQDRWTPKSTQKGEDGGLPGTAQTSNSRPEGVPVLEIGTGRQMSSEDLQRIDKIQAKIQQQLKNRRNFKVDESAGHKTLDKFSFQKTLGRYGIELEDDERDALFGFYDKDGGGELDHQEFIQGVRGSEFVQTARSYGFETPDPGYFDIDEDPEKGLGHYVDITGRERESAMRLGTARCAKAWQQQRAIDGCPFGTDRRMFGGSWQYRTSTLIKAEPVVAPKYGKTGFPARKELNDIMVVIAEKLNERSKGTLAFTRMFNQFDRDKNGSIDREEFEKLLDIFNITLNDTEISVVFEHFGAEDGGIKYKPFVHTVEMQNRKHPLGGYAGSGFGQKAQPLTPPS